MLRVGLVGYGFMGKMHAQCYQATGKARVVALADGEPERREEAKSSLNCEAYPSLDEMLAAAALDAVDICTPTYLHEGNVVAAAGAGKDILCEKPMALSLEACDRMIAAVEQAEVKFMVGQVIRFWPEYQAIKELVDSGRYGEVLWASARRLSPAPTWAWQQWLTDPARSGGGVLDLHIHDLDYLAYLLGSPKRLKACGTPGVSGGLDAVLTLGWEHPNGARTYAEGSLMLPPGYPFTVSLLVACEKAALRFDSGLSPALMVYPAEGGAFAPEIPRAQVAATAASGGNISDLGGYFNEINYFVDCLLAEEQPSVVTAETAREAVRLCLAARESAESGEIVSL